VPDLTRGTQTKLSLGDEEDETPAWSPDGRWVVWSTNRDTKRVILRKRADGSGQEEVLWSGQEHAHVTAFAPGGQSLLFEKQTVERNTDIWLLPLDGSGKERLVVGTAFNDVGARCAGRHRVRGSQTQRGRRCDARTGARRARGFRA
jgi:Tol biopolymer transport system component